MLDSELIFASAQIPTAIGDTPSTNVYDTGSAAGNAQEAEAAMTGENLWIDAICNTPPASGGTIQAVFQDAPDNATWTDRLAGPVLPSAACLPGVPLLQVQPPIGTQRYWYHDDGVCSRRVRCVHLQHHPAQHPASVWLYGQLTCAGDGAGCRRPAAHSLKQERICHACTRETNALHRYPPLGRY
jgi:hypothetical protein